MSHRVLIVEDDDGIAVPLVSALEREGHIVERVSTGQEALDRMSAEPSDVVLLDLGLPDIDGVELCARAREAGYDGAIMIVSGRARELDRVVGLDAGADDYLVKPFGLAELHARMRALLRRTVGRVDGRRLPEGALRVDPAARRVFSGETEVVVTGKEFDVLSLLAAERDKVVPRERLIAEVWDQNWFGSTKTLDVTIGRLRQKLEAAGVTDRIVAVRGVGFRLEGATDA